MIPQSFTRVLTLSLLALSSLLASCGASTIYDPFKPTRVIVFGDSFSLVASSGAYTVNDGSVNNWASQIAANYGVSSVVNQAAGNALVSAVQTQVNNFGANYQAGDLVVVSAGFRDVIDEAAGSNSTSNATAKGTAYANVIRSLVANGAKHVVATNIYDLSKAPAAALTGSTSTNLAALNGARGALVAAFNDAVKTNLGNTALAPIGDNVRLVDLEYYFNLIKGTPNSYSFVDATTVVCTTLGSTVGVGTIDSSACAAADATGASATTYTTPAYNNYVFADAVYPTPAFHRAWGNNVYTQLIARW